MKGTCPDCKEYGIICATCHACPDCHPDDLAFCVIIDGKHKDYTVAVARRVAARSDL